MALAPPAGTHPVQQPTDDLLVALVRGMLQWRHTMFVQYVRAQVMVGVDLLQPVKIVDEYRFENVVHLLRLDTFRHFAGAVCVCVG